MNIVIISLIESILYYICMLIISVKLFDAEYSKKEEIILLNGKVCMPVLKG